MSKLHFTTQHANAATVQHNWFVVDGTNQTVGRMCARIAAVLRGKNKAYYTPHVDCGDYIIVTNAEKINRLRASGRFAYKRQPVTIGHGVDRAGFAGVGAADECHFAPGVGQHLFHLVRRGEKFDGGNSHRLL